MIPVVVISLTRATDRRLAMRQALEARGIAFTFFDAIDGRSISDAEVAALSPRPYIGQLNRRLTINEIACAASHRAALAKFLAGTDQFLCTVEDDVELAPDTPTFLQAETLRRLPAFDILRLVNDPSHGLGLSRVVAQEAGRKVHAPLRAGFYMQGQIFTRAGASKVVAGTVPLSAPIDNLIYRDAVIPALRLLEVRPTLVTARPGPSTIGERFPEPSSSRPVVPMSVELARKRFFITRRLRAIKSYARAWGALSLLSLRYDR
jgi:glycosyl transferase family 25